MEARAFPDTNVSCCAESLASDVLQSTAEIMPLDSDLVERQVLVEAEGITRYVSRSIYFCPRGQLPKLTDVVHGDTLPVDLRRFPVNLSESVHCRLISGLDNFTVDCYLNSFTCYYDSFCSIAGSN